MEKIKLNLQKRWELGHYYKEYWTKEEIKEAKKLRGYKYEEDKTEYSNHN